MAVGVIIGIVVVVGVGVGAVFAIPGCRTKCKMGWRVLMGKPPVDVSDVTSLGGDAGKKASGFFSFGKSKKKGDSSDEN